MGSDLPERGRELERERWGLSVGQLELDIFFFLWSLDEKKPHQRAVEREETQNLGGNIWKIGILGPPFLFLLLFFSLLQSLKFLSPGTWDLRIRVAKLPRRERESEPRPRRRRRHLPLTISSGRRRRRVSEATEPPSTAEVQTRVREKSNLKDLRISGVAYLD